MADPLALDKFNALVVGDGAIGAAIIAALLEKPALERICVLRRSAKPLCDDPRVLSISFDATDPTSLEGVAMQVAESVPRLHLVFNTVGMLHSADQQPEKRLRDVSGEKLMRSFAINAVFLPLLAQAITSLLRHDEPAILASLSARVGSIEDNRLGGWYSYRTSKAAHNMLLRTLAREWRVSHRNVAVVALHPGTVASRLSSPFVAADYKNRVLSPDESAQALLAVTSSLGAEDSGRFFDWRGEPIPW